MNLGTPELLVILVIVLLVFGGARLPKLARSLGLNTETLPAQAPGPQRAGSGADPVRAGINARRYAPRSAAG